MTFDKIFAEIPKEPGGWDNEWPGEVGAADTSGNVGQFTFSVLFSGEGFQSVQVKRVRVDGGRRPQVGNPQHIELLCPLRQPASVPGSKLYSSRLC